jgi:hypothetical protein
MQCMHVRALPTFHPQRRSQLCLFRQGLQQLFGGNTLREFPANVLA